MAGSRNRKYRGRGIRLDRSHYEIPDQITSFTVGTFQRRQALSDTAFVNTCINDLKEAAYRRRVRVLAYCFMPDHMHLLLQPIEAVDLIEFLQRYKSWTTRQAWQYGIHGKLWQRSFYDHILRKEDDTLRHIRYIVENPVRAGLVEDWRGYPFTGSTEYDFSEWDW